MAEYISTFTTGFSEVISKSLVKLLPGAKVLKVYDGLVDYMYNGSDDKFHEINTQNGKVNFVEFIGVTDNELKAIQKKQITVKELYKKIGSDVTSYNRNSVI